MLDKPTDKHPVKRIIRMGKHQKELPCHRIVNVRQSEKIYSIQALRLMMQDR